MKRLSGFGLLVCLLLLLASCSGGASSDDVSFTSTANASETSPKVDAEEPSEEKLASLQDDYEIVLRDSVNWFVMLNHVETDNNLIRYEGILFYTYSGRDIQGRVKAVYNSNPDVLTIQCEDTYDEVNPDMMAYGFVFDSATSRHMRGGWAYLKAKWQGGTAARLLKGAIGAHSAG